MMLRRALAPALPLPYHRAMLDFDTCNDARMRRDPAFDGRFFIAVKTTGIYCRPVCRVRQPLTRNICFYPSAAAAERAGFRPCLRCRPESAPFCPAWNGTKTTTGRALKLIEAGALDGNGTVALLADRCGVGARHLSRLFQAHVGATPIEMAQTLRVQRALRLLNDSQSTISEIALASGFSSLRRFNEVVSARYGRPPSQLRHGRAPIIAGASGS
ncbi:Ada metal-binding domain-containing protein [Sandarakinorhabdus sp.]|uniref:bifunctional transcriptional activator/DNA repair enzyme AdaA n=1 Tax=Sandarakinorhabdus sp. TaxID=1916663 RepID=UPI00286EA02D|nr:Ada metal-binding domain-containing protein [Sandarakinorhabdus sp.]